MTISSTTRKSGPYTGDGVTTSFAITPFTFFSDSTLIRVTKKTIADDTDHGTVLTNPTHYSVSGSNVIMVTAPTALEEILIELIMPQTQLYDYIDGGVFPQSDHETNLDRIIRTIQMLSDIVKRAPKVSPFSTYTDLKIPTPVSGYVLSWKSDLSGLENVVTTGDIQNAASYAASALSSKNSASTSASASASSAAAAAASAAAAAASGALIGSPLQEAPTGTINGSNRNFSLSQTPNNVNAFHVYVDGALLDQSEYQLVARALTLNVAPNGDDATTGEPGQKVWCSYRY